MKKPPLDPDVADTAPSGAVMTAYDEEHLVTYLRMLDADAEGADSAPLASSSFFFSAAQYSASDGSLSKSGLYPFASYFERGTGMVVPVP